MFKIKGFFSLLFFLPVSFFTSKKLRIKKSEDYLMKINNNNTSSLSALYNTNRLLKNKLALKPDPLYHHDAAFTISDQKVSGMIYVMFVMHSMLRNTGNLLKELTDIINARLNEAQRIDRLKFNQHLKLKSDFKKVINKLQNVINSNVKPNINITVASKITTALQKFDEWNSFLPFSRAAVLAPQQKVLPFFPDDFREKMMDLMGLYTTVMRDDSTVAPSSLPQSLYFFVTDSSFNTRETPSAQIKTAQRQCLVGNPVTTVYNLRGKESHILINTLKDFDSVILRFDQIKNSITCIEKHILGAYGMAYYNYMLSLHTSINSRIDSKVVVNSTPDHTYYQDTIPGRNRFITKEPILSDNELQIIADFKNIVKPSEPTTIDELRTPTSALSLRDLNNLLDYENYNSLDYEKSMRSKANNLALIRSKDVESARVVNIHYQLIAQLLASTTALYKKAVHNTIL